MTVDPSCGINLLVRNWNVLISFCTHLLDVKCMAKMLLTRARGAVSATFTLVGGGET